MEMGLGITEKNEMRYEERSASVISSAIFEEIEVRKPSLPLFYSFIISLADFSSGGSLIMSVFSNSSPVITSR